MVNDGWAFQQEDVTSVLWSPFLSPKSRWVRVNESDAVLIHVSPCRFSSGRTGSVPIRSVEDIQPCS